MQRRRQDLTDLHIDRIREALKTDMREVSVVVMPDFFHDRLLNIDTDYHTFDKRIKDVLQRKGGSIDGIDHKELTGGNAMNTASALNALGVSVTPIICTDSAGAEIIQYRFRSCMDLSHVKKMPRSSMTTALEFEIGEDRVNVMLRDIGSLADFGPDNLDLEDYNAIEKADCVCVFNWAGTRRQGTELARTVFKHAKNKGKGLTYLDTADPTPNREKIPEFVENVLTKDYLDILSVNENEAFSFASQHDNRIRCKNIEEPNSQAAIQAAKILSLHLRCRIDLHTTKISATFTREKETIVPAFRVPVLRATGAGDAWNAGNILACILKLPDYYRLTIANAVAALYISNEEGKHADKEQLINFLESAKIETEVA